MQRIMVQYLPKDLQCYACSYIYTTHPLRYVSGNVFMTATVHTVDVKFTFAIRNNIMAAMQKRTACTFSVLLSVFARSILSRFDPFRPFRSVSRGTYVTLVICNITCVRQGIGTVEVTIKFPFPFRFEVLMFPCNGTSTESKRSSPFRATLRSVLTQEIFSPRVTVQTRSVNVSACRCLSSYPSQRSLCRFIVEDGP